MLVLGFLSSLLFSPFQYDETNQGYRLANDVEIEATTEAVFDYLGNSSNASRWSVFVNNIQPLNEGEVADGATGSKRRCFCSPGKPGSYWDEEILDVKKNRLRLLSIYNLKDFPVSMEGLVTEQLYEDKATGSCKLTFSLVKQGKPLGFFEMVKLKWAGYYVAKVFKQNLTNIKADLEK